MKAGWKSTQLSEVCRLINGRAYKKAELLEKGSYPVLRVGNFFTNNHWYYSDLELDVDKYCDRGDLLYAWSASFGPRIWDGGKVIYHYHIWKVVPDSQKITKEYLFHLFDWDKEKIKEEQGTGTTMIHVGKGSMEKRVVPIPPLEEQKQIVAVLDKAFAAIDQAKTNIEKNLQNAKELFQSKLNEIFTQKGEGWEAKKLGDLSYVKSGGTPLRSKKEYWDEGYIPWYSSGELNDLFTKESERFITDKGLEGSNAKLFPKGSLLIGMYDTAALKMSIIDRNATFNQAIAGVVPSESLNLLFILHAINAIKSELLKQRRGVRQKNLSLTKIKDIQLSVPPIGTQNQIVEYLDSLHSEIHEVICKYQQQLCNLECLNKTILQKAFSGELLQ